MRGALTPKIQELSKAFFKRKMTTIELRLIPYVQYVMLNEQKLDPQKINSEERTIFMQWKKDGHCKGGITGLSVTKEFWDFMCEVLFEAYVKGGEE